MARPRYCPACAAPLPEGCCGAMLIASVDQDGKPAPPYGCDVYCAACGWSGDIMPDDETEEPAGGQK